MPTSTETADMPINKLVEENDAGTMEVLDRVDPMKEDFQLPDFNQYESGQAGKVLNYSTKSVFSLLVSSIPNYFTEKGLENLFSKYGKVQRAIILRSDKSMGFVDFKKFPEAEAAIKALHQTKPHKLSVRFSIPKKEKELQKKKRDETTRKMRKHHEEAASRIKEKYSNQTSPPAVEEVVDETASAEEESDEPVSKLEVLLNATRHVLERLKVPKGHDKALIITPKGVTVVPVTQKPAPVPLQETSTCGFCFQMAQLRCGDCGAWYCTRPCQADDWLNHEPLCKKVMAAILLKTPQIAKISSEQESGESPEKDLLLLPTETTGVQDTLQLASSLPVDCGHQSPPEVGPVYPTFTYDSCQRATLRVGIYTYLYFANILSADTLFCMATKETVQLEALIKEMTDYGQSLTYTHYRPVFGEVCLVRYTDNRWHRAVVLEVGPAVVKLMLADYPFILVGEPALIRRIPPEFISALPLQAIPVKFHGIELEPSKLEQATKYLSYSLCRAVYSTVKSLRGGFYHIIAENVSFGLVDMGLATKTPDSSS